MDKTWFWLLIICIAGVIVRVALPWGDIFTGGHVNFSGHDSYYHIMSMKNMLAGFPCVDFAQGKVFYDFCVVGLTWLVSLGHPTLPLLEKVAVFVPPLLALGTVLFAFFIGRRLFGNVAGLIAASTMAVLPGEYFGRTILGSIDHHAFEVFATTGAIYCLIEIAMIKRILNWKVPVLIIGAVCFILAYFFSWIGAPVITILLTFFAIWVIAHKIFPESLKLRIVTMGACLLVFILSLWPYLGDLVNTIIKFPGAILTATQETQPGWSDYLVSLHILLLLGFMILVYRSKLYLKWPLLVWSGFLVVATLWQRRFDYYLIVPLSLLLGYAMISFYRNILSWGKEFNEP